MVRAKLRCNTARDSGIEQEVFGKTVKGRFYDFGAVMVEKDADGNVIGNKENAVFGVYTPAAQFNMNVYNDRVNFEVGKEYYVDFTPAEETNV